MSLARQIKRYQMRENMRLNGMRSRCRKCGGEMVTKPGYGWLCRECGWQTRKQVESDGR